MKQKERLDIVDAPLIGEREFRLIDKQHKKTKFDKHRLVKYKLFQTYLIQNNKTPAGTVFDEAFIKQFEAIQHKFKNILIMEQHANNIEVFVEQKISELTKSNNIQLIHERYNFLKIFAADQLVKAMFFKNIFDNKTQITHEWYRFIIPFMSEHGEDLNCLFDTSFDWGSFIPLYNATTDEDELKILRKKITTYCNSILKNVFNITLKRTAKKKSPAFVLHGIDAWHKIKEFNIRRPYHTGFIREEIKPRLWKMTRIEIEA